MQPYKKINKILKTNVHGCRIIVQRVAVFQALKEIRI